MKGKFFSSVIFVALLSTALFSCDKNDDDDNTNVTPTNNAGKGDGGNITFRVTSEHKGLPIDSCKVYVRYNSEVRHPATNLYDDSMVCVQEDGKPTATFYELRKGTYLFYARGWDHELSKVVHGSRSYNADKERVTTNLTIQMYIDTLSGQ